MVPIPGGTDRIVAALDKGEIDAGKNATPYHDPGRAQGLRRGRLHQPDHEPGLQPDRAAGDQDASPTSRARRSACRRRATPSRCRRCGCSPPRASRRPTTRPRRWSARRRASTASSRANAPRCRWDSRRISTQSSKAFRASASPTRRAPTSSSTSTWCGARWGEKNKDTLVRFVRAMASTYAFMNDPKNRDEVVAIVRETGKISDEVARQIFAPYLEPDKNVLPRRGEIELAGLQPRAGADGRGRRDSEACTGGGTLRRPAVSEGGGDRIGRAIAHRPPGSLRRV